MISFVCATVAGVQVFHLKKSLPVKPYGQSGPKLLTRNTTRRAWQATFKLMKENGIERVAMLGVPGIGKSRNLALGLWHGVTGRELEGVQQPEAIVYEAREGGAVFLFTKDSGWRVEGAAPADGVDWKLRIRLPAPARNSKNWYLVDASEKTTTLKLYAKTCARLQPRTGPLLEIYQRRRLLRFY